MPGRNRNPRGHGAGRRRSVPRDHRSWPPRTRPGSRRRAGRRGPATIAIGAEAGAAWYRLDPVLDEHGSLAGQRLTVGLVGGPARHLDLAPESFVSGPVGGVVLVGDDDGTESRLRLLDVVARV